MRCPRFSLIGLVILALCFAFGCGGGPEPAGRVLIITLDTVRADALGCYGFDAPPAITPNLDRLAEQGTIFRRATCQIPATLTSHTAILTGRLPRSTGVRFGSDRVPDDVVTLAEICHEAGFSTAAFISSAVLDAAFGLDQGFDVYVDVAAREDDPEAERSAEQTTDLALDWLRDRQPDEPFLLWVHYYDAHSPYEPSPADDIFGPADYDGPINGSANQITRLVATKGEGVTARDLERLRSLYLAEVSCVDRQVGRLLETFDAIKTDLLSMVVAVSDHGENLGEGGRFFHGADLFETCMHIPLIIRWPRGRYKSTQLEDLVMGMDVMPTILKACALPIPEAIEGRDMGAYLQSRKPTTRTSRIGLLETEHAYLSDADKVFGAASHHWKLIDRRHHRRSPVLVGRSVGIPLIGPCYLRALVRGDDTACVVAHIRFHAAKTARSSDQADVENQPTILVRASRLGIEPIHFRHDLPQTPERWTALATTDLHRRATKYGHAQGWPVEHIVIESIAVDVGGVPGQRTVDVWVDNVALVGEKTLILNDFEGENVEIYRDAGVGMKHIAGSRVEPGQGVEGSAGLHVVAKYPPGENVWEGSELYRFENPMFTVERENLLLGRVGDMPEEARKMARIIDEWLKNPLPPMALPATIDPETEKALRSLGYL